MTSTNSTEFIVSTPISSFKAKFVAPKWAPGFECESEKCGLCCISEMPNGVPAKNFQPLNCMICKYFNVDKKKCTDYVTRPWGCKMYPFIYGIEDGTIVISASLDCPSTNLKALNIHSIEQAFEDVELSKAFAGLELMYLQTKGSIIWHNADEFWAELEPRIINLFELKSNFPFFYKAKKLIFNFFNAYYNVQVKPQRFRPMDVILTDMLKNKSAISTDFQSNNLFHVKIKNERAQVISHNFFSKKTEITQFTLPKKPLKLSVESDALALLKDYVELLMKRPFLSLSAVTLATTGVRCNLPSMVASQLVGAFINIEAGATFTALKNDCGIVDKNAMREIISFADGCLCGTFKNPSISIH